MLRLRSAQAAGGREVARYPGWAGGGAGDGGWGRVRAGEKSAEARPFCARKQFHLLRSPLPAVMDARPALYADKEFQSLVRRLRSRAKALRAEQEGRRRRRLSTLSASIFAVFLSAAATVTVVYGLPEPIRTSWAHVDLSAFSMPALPPTTRRILHGLLHVSMVPAAAQRGTNQPLLYLEEPVRGHSEWLDGWHQPHRADGVNGAPHRPASAIHAHSTGNDTSLPAVEETDDAPGGAGFCAAATWLEGITPANHSTAPRGPNPPPSDSAPSLSPNSSASAGTAVALATAVAVLGSAALALAVQIPSLRPGWSIPWLANSTRTCERAAPAHSDPLAVVEAAPTPSRPTTQAAAAAATTEPIAEVLEVSNRMLEDPSALASP